VDTPPVAGETDPEEFFLTEVLPLLDARCNTCHTDIATAPVFIDPADPYTSLLDSGVVSIGAPGASTLLTKGAHRGPAWRAEEVAVISDWITLEAGAGAGGGGAVDPPGGGGGGGGGEDPPPDPVVGDYETNPQAIVDGDNTIDLDDVGLPGAEIRFFAQRVALGLHISSVTLYAGNDAVVITHPTFISHEGGTNVPDPEDRFSALELVVPAEGAALVAENILFVDFPLDGELSISFTSTATL
jgi:hypothetical protein